MEDLKTNVGQLKDHVSDYAKTYVDLVKAKATRGASNAAAAATIGILSFVLAFFFYNFYAGTFRAFSLSQKRCCAMAFINCVASFLGSLPVITPPD